MGDNHFMQRRWKQRTEAGKCTECSENGNCSVQLDYRINGESAGRQRWLWRKKRSKLIGKKRIGGLSQIMKGLSCCTGMIPTAVNLFTYPPEQTDRAFCLCFRKKT